jgi:hypothetical protein
VGEYLHEALSSNPTKKRKKEKCLFQLRVVQAENPRSGGTICLPLLRATLASGYAGCHHLKNTCNKESSHARQEAGEQGGDSFALLITTHPLKKSLQEISINPSQGQRPLPQHCPKRPKLTALGHITSKPQQARDE